MEYRYALFVAIITLFILSSTSFSQYAGEDGLNCYNSCWPRCGTACATSSCAEQCVYKCASDCGLYAIDDGGITPGKEDCDGITAPDGHPTFYYNGDCVDVYYWEDYCSQAASCNQCHNLPAYSCIWSSGACVPCKGSSCIKSCGGGTQYDGGTQDNWQDDNGGEGTSQIKIGPDGELIYPGNQACLAYTSCYDCTNAAQIFTALAGCKWFPDSGTCIDMAGGIDQPESCTYTGEEGYNPGINQETDRYKGYTSYSGSDSVCPISALLVLIAGFLFYRNQEQEKSL